MPDDSYSSLRKLQLGIDALLKEAMISADVHSIQMLTAQGTDLKKAVSYFLSKEPEKFERSIKEFTGFDDSTNHFRRSLAVFDIESKPYWLGHLANSSAGPTALVQNDHSFGSLAGWHYQPGDAGDFATAQDAWLKVLGAYFPGPGSALWVTQRVSHVPDEPNSAAFVLLTGILPHQREDLAFRISKLLRDALVTQLVLVHQEALKALRDDQALLLQRALTEANAEMPLAPAVSKTIQLYAGAIAGKVPILIVGEAGTGKLAVARTIHKAREALLFKKGGPTPPTENPSIFLRASALPAEPSEIRARLGQAFGGDGAALQSMSPLIVVDDVQNSSPAAQDTFLKILDQSFPARPGSPDQLAHAKWLFAALPGLDALVSAGQFSASLYAQISAFELVCPPLHERLRDPGDATAILRYSVGSIARALDMPEPTLDELERQHIIAQRWPGNFRDLNNYLVRRLLERQKED